MRTAQFQNMQIQTGKINVHQNLHGGYSDGEIMGDFPLYTYLLWILHLYFAICNFFYNEYLFPLYNWICVCVCIYMYTYTYIQICKWYVYIYIYIISQTKAFLLWWTFTAHIYIFRKRSISAFLPLSLFENTWPLAHNNWEFLFPCPTSALPINLMSTIFQIYPETTFTITTVGQEMTVSCLDDFFLP